MTKQRRKPKAIADDLIRQDLAPCKYFLSTGSTLLDLAISDRYPGGVGSGRTTQIIGDNATAKTVVLKEILGAAQRLGGFAAELDVEYTPDHERSKLFGLDVGKWIEEETQHTGPDMELKDAITIQPNYVYRHPQTVEDVFDKEVGGLLKLQDSGKIKGPVVFGVDTFTALPSKAELERELDEASYNMERAKKMSGGFRKWLKKIAEADAAIVAVDHIRDNVGTTFGRKWTTSGGKAMQQYASTRIFLAMEKKLKKNDIVCGVKIKFSVVKNKLAPPFRDGWFYVMFDYGIDDIRGNLEWLKERGEASGDCLLQQRGAWWNWGDKKMGQGLGKAVRWIEENEMEKVVEKEVARIWAIVYAPSSRKKKER